MNIYIYGTGLIAKHLSYYFRDEINILGYIESEPSKTMTEWGGGCLFN